MPYHRLGGFEFTPGVEPDIDPSVLGDALIDCIHKVTIERDVFTGHDVMILTGSHNPTVFGPRRRVTSGGGPVTIREGAWICSRAIIVGPVTIGRHAVVAAGAVVIHDVPDYALVAGNPARVKKLYSRFVNPADADDLAEWMA